MINITEYRSFDDESMIIDEGLFDRFKSNKTLTNPKQLITKLSQYTPESKNTAMNIYKYYVNLNNIDTSISELKSRDTLTKSSNSATSKVSQIYSKLTELFNQIVALADKIKSNTQKSDSIYDKLSSKFNLLDNLLNDVSSIIRNTELKLAF